MRGYFVFCKEEADAAAEHKTDRKEILIESQYKDIWGFLSPLDAISIDICMKKCHNIHISY